MQIPGLQGLNSLFATYQVPRQEQVARTSATTPVEPVSAVQSVQTPNVSATEQSQALSPLDLGPLQDQARLNQAFILSSQRSEFSITGDGFTAQGYSQSASFSGTFSGAGGTLQLNIEVTQSVVGISFGAGAIESSGNDLFAQLSDKLPEDARALLDQFLGGSLAPDYFSPENTANRIADFALGGFSFFEGGKAAAENSQDSRQRFADFILPAIDQGIREALDILGDMPSPILEDVEQTRDLIGERFDAFVNGLDNTA